MEKAGLNRATWIAVVKHNTIASEAMFGLDGNLARPCRTLDNLQIPTRPCQVKQSNAMRTNVDHRNKSVNKT